MLKFQTSIHSSSTVRSHFNIFAWWFLSKFLITPMTQYKKRIHLKNTQESIRTSRKARGHNQTSVVGDFISLSQHNVAHYSMGDSIPFSLTFSPSPISILILYFTYIDTDTNKTFPRKISSLFAYRRRCDMW